MPVCPGAGATGTNETEIMKKDQTCLKRAPGEENKTEQNRTKQRQNSEQNSGEENKTALAHAPLEINPNNNPSSRISAKGVALRAR